MQRQRDRLLGQGIKTRGDVARRGQAEVGDLLGELDLLAIVELDADDEPDPGPCRELGAQSRMTPSARTGSLGGWCLLNTGRLPSKGAGNRP